MKPIFPHYIDNSMRKDLVKCQKSAHYRYELGLQSKQAKRVDLVAGKAFAAGIEAARKAYFGEGHYAPAQVGVNALFVSYGSFVPPKESNKTAERMAGALLAYLEKYPLESEKLVPFRLPNGKLALEFYFEHPIGIPHPDDGKELHYCGNFDMLAIDENADLWVVDEKTTSSMGDKWANQWPLDSQLTGYVWGAQRLLDQLGLPHKVKGAIVNGIAIKKYDYDCGRFSVYREPWEVERWYEQMTKDVRKWIAAYRFDDHDLNLDHSCAYYLNPCEFAPLCLSKNPERLYEGMYVVEFWNPKDRK